jgi:hypothetical protein
MVMVQYFGVIIREKPDGMKLTRDNYIKVSRKSSLIPGQIYDLKGIFFMSLSPLF